MIKQIVIKNYILIDELVVEFDNGFNVITGETGAGKSIVINAIDLVFAPRVSKDVIKSGCDKASIELTIGYAKNDLSQLFEENGIDNFGDEIIISKELTQNSVRTRVNGSLVNQDFVRVLKDKFLDIHSQNQTYSFLQPKFHISLLDSYAQDLYGTLLDEYKLKFAVYKELCSELEKVKSLSSATENEIEFLKFQIDEIEAAQIEDVEEYDNLKNELNVLENVEKLKELTGSSYWALSGDDGSILSALGDIKRNISKAVGLDISLESLEEELINLMDALSGVSSVIRDYSQNLDNDTERLNLIQERIFLLDKLKRKYGGTLQEVLNTYENLYKEYSHIENSVFNIEELECKIQVAIKELNKIAEDISSKRVSCAETLSDLIVKKLEGLELPKVKFKISIQECEINQNGKDNVEFLISTNVSEDLKPLAKVASGGEVSRVMLAIKSIFAANDEIDTVIFDEIDTGISGKASQSVADELAELSKYHQVIVITHQAIIASKAVKHFYVSKSQEAEKTQVEFRVIDGESRINALAELAAGEVNAQSLEFARALVG